MMDFVSIPKGSNMYTLGATGLDKINYVCESRTKAEKCMYQLCKKHNLRIVEKYDDNHFKTYVCSNGVKFYINKVC